MSIEITPEILLACDGINDVGRVKTEQGSYNSTGLGVMVLFIDPPVNIPHDNERIDISIIVCDAKDAQNWRESPRILGFTRDEWAAFILGVKQGEFDI